jgi:hypothetical protein
MISLSKYSPNTYFQLVELHTLSLLFSVPTPSSTVLTDWIITRVVQKFLEFYGRYVTLTEVPSNVPPRCSLYGARARSGAAAVAPPPTTFNLPRTFTGLTYSQFELIKIKLDCKVSFYYFWELIYLMSVMGLFRNYLPLPRLVAQADPSASQNTLYLAHMHLGLRGSIGPQLMDPVHMFPYFLSSICILFCRLTHLQSSVQIRRPVWYLVTCSFFLWR